MVHVNVKGWREEVNNSSDSSSDSNSGESHDEYNDTNKMEKRTM